MSGPNVEDMLRRRDLADRDIDCSVWGDDLLIEKVVVLRTLIRHERDDRVRVFIGMQLEAVILEMDRRNQERIERKLRKLPPAPAADRGAR